MTALPCDAYHHYFHYQSSAQYTWLAKTCLALGKREEAAQALKKALFQDHYNAEAKALSEGKETSAAYDKHPDEDSVFCASIGRERDAATATHDEAVAKLCTGDFPAAEALFTLAIKVSPAHSNSYFGLGRVYFLQGQFERAREALSEAVRLSHLAHDAYHRAASSEHVQRARAFLTQGEVELAINDFNKALDLHRGNEEALRERAQACALRQV